jgi:hypothetical protein
MQSELLSHQHCLLCYFALLGSCYRQLQQLIHIEGQLAQYHALSSVVFRVGQVVVRIAGRRLCAQESLSSLLEGELHDLEVVKEDTVGMIGDTLLTGRAVG